MGIFKKLALLGAFALLLPGTAALAADMPQAPVYVPPSAGPVEFGSGWYLRGDVGYKLWSTPKVTFYNDNLSTTDYDDVSLGNTWVAGGGFGYKFNPWLRTDVTLDYEGPANFNAHVPCDSGCDPAYTIDHAKVSAWTVLANAYVDLPLGGEGALGGLTPYVGAGVGLSRVSWSGYSSTCPGGTCGDPNPADYGTTTQWRFAWALMAGVSYSLTQQWVLDANYRFLDIANGLAVAHVGDPAFGHSGYKNLYAQEFRIGLRYLIN